MGVYIKDLEKPENCDVCPIFLVFTTCGLDRDHCMFQEVPEPHGRLIDADVLEQDVQKRLLMCNKNDNQFQKPYEVMRAIALAPTIVPASEELPKMCG